MKTAALAVLCVLLTSVAQLGLKIGADSVSMASAAGWQGFLRGILTNWIVLGAFALYSASGVLWLFVLAKADVSYAYPFVSLGFVLMAVAAAMLLGETLGPLRMAGTALICVGVVLVARS